MDWTTKAIARWLISVTRFQQKQGLKIALQALFYVLPFKLYATLSAEQVLR